MYIDPELQERQQQTPDKVVEVILVCKTYNTTLKLALEQAGFQITDVSQAEAGLIYGHFRLADLAKLETITQLESASPDTPQTML